MLIQEKNFINKVNKKKDEERERVVNYMYIEKYTEILSVAIAHKIKFNCIKFN